METKHLREYLGKVNTENKKTGILGPTRGAEQVAENLAWKIADECAQAVDKGDWCAIEFDYKKATTIISAAIDEAVEEMRKTKDQAVELNRRILKFYKEALYDLNNGDDLNSFADRFNDVIWEFNRDMAALSPDKKTPRSKGASLGG